MMSGSDLMFGASMKGEKKVILRPTKLFLEPLYSNILGMCLVRVSKYQCVQDALAHHAAQTTEMLLI